MNRELEHILEQCLQGIEQQGHTVEDCLARYPAHRATLEPLLRAALALRQARSYVHPSAAFRAQSPRRLRARLHATRRVSQARPVFGTLRLWRLAAVGLFVIALALASGGLAYAADGAAPGDPLYPLDRALEQAQLRLTARSAHALELRLRFAAERLDEAAHLLAAGKAAHVQQALADYDVLVAEAQQMAEPASQPVIGIALGNQQVRLVGLLLAAPPEAQAVVEDALDAASPLATHPGAPCAAAQVQPALTALAERYGASYDDLLARFCAGYGVGTISRAYRLSEESGVAVEEIFARREAGQSWGAIQQELREKKGSPPQEPPGHSGGAPGKPAETPQPSEESPGRSGEAAGQSNRPSDHTPGPPQSPPGRNKDKAKDANQP